MVFITSLFRQSWKLATLMWWKWHLQYNVCLTGNYRKGNNEYTIPYLETVLEAPKERIWYSSYQSEEGGRFFHEQNLNIIVEAGDDFPIEVEENYCWMTLNQMLSFVTYNNYLNIAARSLLSAISFY